MISQIKETSQIKKSGQEKYQILGKLVAFMIYTATQTILSHFKDRKEADKFNGRLFLLFLKKFNETKETLIDFERDNPAMGDSQVIWSLGSQISKLLGKEDIFLATGMAPFTLLLTKLEIESTEFCLNATFDELKEKIKSCEPNKLLYQNGGDITIMPLYKIGTDTYLSFFGISYKYKS